MSSSSGANLENFLIPLEEINRATENFSEERCIGSGGFGNVYRGQLCERWQNRSVAIKRLAQKSYQGKHEFRNELEMISRFQHENIISFIGYCDESNEMIIVYEYTSNGSLDQHIKYPNKWHCITWTQRLKICIGAARGLNYLHTGVGEHNRIIHRDIKSANILLDENFVAKISDFGLSKSGPRNQPNTEVHTKIAGTNFYLDPSYQECGILRKEADVYSFGMVLFEILSGMLAYRPRSIGNDRQQYLINFVRRYYPDEVHKLIDPHVQDQIDSRSFDTFKEIAYQCISLNLTERPMMVKVIEKINEALDTEEVKNKDGKLVTKCEMWMKATALHGMVFATLVATVVYATAFIPPGGYMYRQKAGLNVISLIFSLASILMFLSVLTSHYAQHEFESLAKKLMIGLVTFFVSMVTMIVAFYSAGFFTLSAVVPLVVFGIWYFRVFLDVFYLAYPYKLKTL